MKRVERRSYLLKGTLAPQAKGRYPPALPTKVKRLLAPPTKGKGSCASLGNGENDYWLKPVAGKRQTIDGGLAENRRERQPCPPAEQL